MKPATAKYSERIPIKAKMFEEKTRNGSGVIAKMAGMESVAKTKSVDLIAISTIRSGVTKRFSFLQKKKRSRGESGGKRKKRLKTRITRVLSGCISFP